MGLLACVIVLQSPLAWSGCLTLGSGVRLHASTSSRQPACIFVSVNGETPTRITVEQPEDLELTIKLDGSPDRRVDSFQFGPESLTLYRGGEYRIEVRPTASTPSTELTFKIWREETPSNEAALWELAEAQATLSKKSRALEDINESMDLWQKIGDSSSIARTHLKYGDNRLAVGDPSAARDSYEKAFDLCNALSDNRCIAEAANNSGLTSEQIGDFPLALTRLQRAAEGWKNDSNPLYQGRTLSNLGLLFRRTGDFQRAISFYSQARLILRRVDAVSYARVLNNLGLCYTSLTEYDKAMAYLNSALDIYRDHKSTRDSARTRLNLGRTLMLAGQLVRAEGIMKQALKEVTEDRAAHADVLNNLGQLALRRKSYSQGQAWLSEALDLDHSLGDRRGEASALHYLGLILQATGDSVKAVDYLERAAKSRSDLGLRDDAADSLYALAQLQYEQGNTSVAKQMAEESLSLLESVRKQVPTPNLRAAFYSNKRRIFDLLLEIAMTSRGPHAPAEGLLESERGKARALLDLLAEGSVLRHLAPNYLERRAGIQQRIDLLLVQLSSAASDQQEATRRQLELLFAEDTEGEAQMRQTLTSQNLGLPLTSVDELQRWLPPDSALLEFHLGGKNGYLWLVRVHDIHVFPLPANSLLEPIIKHTVDLFENVLGRQRSAQQQAIFEQGIRRLSSVLLGCLKDLTLPRRLIIVPDGALYRVPFAALWLPRTMQRVGLVHELIQAPGAGYLMVGRQPREIKVFPKTILAMGDPVFSPDDPRVKPIKVGSRGSATSEPLFARLPFRADIDMISSMVPAPRRAILLGFGASTTRFREQHLEDFAVIYVSSHAMIDDRTPELSRIALSQVDPAGAPVDGFLRPYHLAEFHLNGSTVILSACETALGKQVLGEGLAGFTSSLFVAGAAQLVLSLNNVDAEGTSHFFSEMFQRYLSPRNPETIERSMLFSRRAMASSNRWSDPYYWGSFAVVGRPTEATRQAKPMN